MKKIFFIPVVLTILSCKLFQPNSTEDKNLPSVQITFPADNATIDENIFVKASAVDNEDLEWVRFFIDGDTVFTDVTSPYEYYWGVAFWSDGKRHTLYAEAADRHGNIGQSAVINVNVNVSGRFTPQLITPSNAAAIEKTGMSFLWRAFPGAEHYEFQVSSSPNFFAPFIRRLDIPDTTFHSDSMPEGDYFWRVRAQNRQGRWTAWSTVNAFSICDLALFESNRGLVAYYPLNGNAYDESPNGYHGTVQGAVPCKDRFGNPRCAYQFDGDAYIDFGDVFNNINIPFSISMWIYCTQYPLSFFNCDCFYNKGISIYYGFWFKVFDDGRLEISYGDGNCAGYQCRRSKFSSEILPLNQWVHIAASVNGPYDMKIFIFGHDAGGSYDGDGGTMTHNDWPAYLAGYHAVGLKIDDVRIYDRAVRYQ